MFVMTNQVRDYAWGSTTQMSDFLGRPPSGAPEAELWIGAHDGAPSALPDGRLLNAVLADDARPHLGPRAHEQFGGMPFLMKVLAVEQVLSLQVHPTNEQARAGYEREDAEGVPVDAGHRNYKDRSHKPEMVFALTRFEGMAGFRDVERTVLILKRLQVRWADRAADVLVSGLPADTLRTLVTDTLRTPGKQLAPTLREVAIAARHCEARAKRQELRHRSSAGGRGRSDPEAIRVFGRIAALAERYPKDPGVLVALLLNNVVLSPGEAMFLPAGNIHAYVAGLGVEIMASSDNVLRAGLTPKHVDADELLAITDFTPVPPPLVTPAEKTEDYVHLAPPVAEFALTVGKAPLRRIPGSGPRVVLCLEGAVELRAGAESTLLTQGQSAFVSHDDGAVEVSGPGRVAIGAVSGA